jgi:hypothetical protein
MRRVRGVVHGQAARLIAPQKGGLPDHEATLDRAFTPQSFLSLFTPVRGRLFLRG